MSLNPICVIDFQLKLSNKSELFIYLFVCWRAIEDQIYTILEFIKNVLLQQDLEGREHLI